MTTPHVTITEPAQRDIRAILSVIHQENPTAAADFADNLKSKFAPCPTCQPSGAKEATMAPASGRFLSGIT